MLEGFPLCKRGNEGNLLVARQARLGKDVFDESRFGDLQAAGSGEGEAEEFLHTGGVCCGIHLPQQDGKVGTPN